MYLICKQTNNNKKKKTKKKQYNNLKNAEYQMQ